ncbi:hypothetical protein VOLCADRAFT_104691 [Volvox carteri f. nagariensis]|uniref:Uncharacterized protein n=1 Tax=Volvox carteri f. nagariensis TaxID=3068 RepID=D8TV42_VOLCA|nr:uncharacterized protein VOLCADRAFT_104691 [Volvox carteri f. nagariensis]EFJ48637.1 hypothetical protein VOLCADRAFT_104691 [Volvox carteri f. nagariensis]|eukprot:XP_002950436.1 hypothetical protein VOLCADRAFT_104691 [Volvox carteri f. nagariensis]
MLDDLRKLSVEAKDLANERLLRCYRELFEPIFFQDLPLFYALYPDNPVYRTPWFDKWMQEGSLRRWFAIQQTYCRHMDAVVEGKQRETTAFESVAVHVRSQRDLAMQYMKARGVLPPSINHTTPQTMQQAIEMAARLREQLGQQSIDAVACDVRLPTLANAGLVPDVEGGAMQAQLGSGGGITGHAAAIPSPHELQFSRGGGPQPAQQQLGRGGNGVDGYGAAVLQVSRVGEGQPAQQQLGSGSNGLDGYGAAVLQVSRVGVLQPAQQ